MNAPYRFSPETSGPTSMLVAFRRQVGVVAWLGVVALAVAVTLGAWRATDAVRHPATPAQSCVGWVRTVNAGDVRLECRGGQIETTPTDGTGGVYAIAVCRCQAR